jgi:hypothetical protein
MTPPEPAGPLTDANARLFVRGTASAGAATAFVAAIAGLCCAGPLTVALLGAGGAVAAAGIKPFRVPLLGASLALLIAAFWRAYAPRAKTAGAACPIAIGRATRIALWAAAFVWWGALLLYVVF